MSTHITEAFYPINTTGFTATGYNVESTTSLIPPVAWQTNSTPPIVIGGQDFIISPISLHNRFSGSRNENELQTQKTKL